jgi:tetraacyldisaccharide 4'-kinase
MNFLERAWYKKAGWLILLWPIAFFFQGLTKFRRAFQQGNSRPTKHNVPVVVIGNISVGGTGKTPLLIAIVQQLQTVGLRPGIISRGFGGAGAVYPMQVNGNDNPAIAGDEPVLIARKTNCPVVIDPDRRSALDYLLDSNKIDVVLSDDGLQHYKLFRNIEVIVVDGQREFGNEMCFPAGPLREPIQRLQEADFIVINVTGLTSVPMVSSSASMTMEPKGLVNMVTGEKRPFDGAPFNMGNKVQAVSGIGNPKRFYDLLDKLPYQIIPLEFPDHHQFLESDFQSGIFDEHQPIVMTEKDAIKCEKFAKNNFWYLQTQVRLQDSFLEEFTNKIKTFTNKND